MRDEKLSVVRRKSVISWCTCSSMPGLLRDDFTDDYEDEDYYDDDCYSDDEDDYAWEQGIVYFKPFLYKRDIIKKSTHHILHREVSY